MVIKGFLKMKANKFIQNMKERATQELLAVSGKEGSEEKTCTFKIGTANMVTIRGGAIEKAAITHMKLKNISIKRAPGDDMGVAYADEGETVDTTVYQMEVFPENPYCPMGHFNTEWSRMGPGPYQYSMNLDLFPAVKLDEDLERMKHVMDGVADKYGKDRNKMRQGLEIHYNMEHWSAPLAAKVGCKLLALEETDFDLFTEAYRSFFEVYIDILKLRKDVSYSDAENRLKLERNGKWLEYISLKDGAVRAGQDSGISPDVLISMLFPPSGVF
jgi:coproporphyrinogen III oxidase